MKRERRALRFGWSSERLVFIQAALLAADAAGRDGFAAADVRFYFLLFTNWVEHDVIHPGQNLELTQVRRVIQQLAQDKWLTPVKRRGSASGGRGARFVLHEKGAVGLASALSMAVESGRPFEETLFVICFALSYGSAVRARVKGERASASAKPRSGTLLDPHALLARARKHTRALLADLEERVVSGRQLAEDLARVGGDLDAIEKQGTRSRYQLHRVRPLTDALRALPDDVRAFELTRGMGVRVDLLFAPLAERARAELAILDRLAAKLD